MSLQVSFQEKAEQCPQCANNGSGWLYDIQVCTMCGYSELAMFKPLAIRKPWFITSSNLDKAHYTAHRSLKCGWLRKKKYPETVKRTRVRYELGTHRPCCGCARLEYLQYELAWYEARLLVTPNDIWYQKQITQYKQKIEHLEKHNAN